jgi:hypothetical protein
VLKLCAFEIRFIINFCIIIGEQKNSRSNKIERGLVQKETG